MAKQSRLPRYRSHIYGLVVGIVGVFLNGGYILSVEEPLRTALFWIGIGITIYALYRIYRTRKEIESLK